MSPEFGSGRPEQKSLTELFREIGMDDKVMLAAQGAARLGARQFMKFYGASPEKLKTVLKAEAGMTPVTAADLASEQIILDIITRRLFPVESVHSEEAGQVGDESQKEIMWYVDPLDGTRSFTREQKTSTVGICVYEKGEARSAAICRPFQGELLVAEKGKGAFLFPIDGDQRLAGNPNRIHVSDRHDLNGGIFYWDGVMTNNSSGPSLRLFEEIMSKNASELDFRAIGTNIGQQAEVAMGRGDLCLTTAVGGFYDIAAGGLIIEEAGGKFVDINGKTISRDTVAALGGNKDLVDGLLPLFKESFKYYKGFK